MYFGLFCNCAMCIKIGNWHFGIDLGIFIFCRWVREEISIIGVYYRRLLWTTHWWLSNIMPSSWMPSSHA